MKPTILLVLAALVACSHPAKEPTTVGSDPDDPPSSNTPKVPLPDLRGRWFVAVAESANEDPARRVLPGMRDVALRVLAEDGKMETTWGSGGMPTKDDLLAAGATGAHVGIRIKELSNTVLSAQQTEIACALEITLGSYPELELYAHLKGAAKVEVRTDPGEIALGEQDCVDAVVEDLIGKKAIPAIQQH